MEEEEFFLELAPDQGPEGEHGFGFGNKLCREPIEFVWRNGRRLEALEDGMLACVSQWLVSLILVCLAPEHALFRLLVRRTVLQARID